MGFIESVYTMVPEFVWEIVSLLGSAFAILFIHFSGKYRNAKLEIKWYILAFFFPLITTIVYLSKRKRYKKIEYKVCGNCGDLYPLNYEICTRCLAELPDYNPKKKSRQKTLATVFLCIYFVTYLFDFMAGVMVISDVFHGLSQQVTAESRIGIVNENGDYVYYDRNGEEYDDELELLFYDREGNVYYYTYDGGDCFYKDDGEVSIWEEDDIIPAYNCFVDEDGYFVDVSGQNRPVIIIEDAENKPQYYFETPYGDSEGNLYYPAMFASWNSDGELITSAEQVGKYTGDRFSALSNEN